MFDNLEWERAFEIYRNPKTYDVGLRLLVELSHSRSLRFLEKLDQKSLDRHEDIVLNVFTRLLSTDKKTEFFTLAEFWRYMFQSLRNERLSLVQSANERKAKTGQDLSQVPVDHSPEFFRSLEQWEFFCHADNCWLGKPPKYCQELLVAATYIFRDRTRISEVIRVMKCANPKLTDIDAAWLVKGISGTAILRRLAYQEIHHTPAEVHRIVDGKAETELESARLAIRYRFLRFATATDSIKHVPTEQRTVVGSLLSYLETQLPFHDAFKLIYESLEKSQRNIADFSLDPLWKRVVFQYKIYNLKHADMATWFGPLATTARYTLGEKRLHDWFGNHVLENELRKYLKENGGI